MDPKFLFVDFNKRCNFKCTHCALWKNKDYKSTYISFDIKKEIIKEFSTISKNGSVVICGGEGTLDLEDYLTFSSYCRSLGLRCLSVTNGSAIINENIANRFMLEGPSEITVSLDSPFENINDKLRGVKGAFNIATKTVRLLVDARKNLNAKTKIYVMGLISEVSYRSLDIFYHLVLNILKADKLKLNFLQPTFGAAFSYDTDHFFRENYIKDYKGCIELIHKMDAKYKLNYNPFWYKAVEANLKSISEKQTYMSEHICNSYERNIMVDFYGNLRLCFCLSFGNGKWQKTGDLKKFWDESDPIREKMKTCKAFCGISHSVRKENATLK
jgi:MoaA/NifB/PqqE/SkfB family radical SAM enzyme